MTIKFAFAGFRHSHILDLYRRVLSHPDTEYLGGYDPNPQDAQPILDAAEISLNYKSLDDLLNSDCDVVAVGDVYANRGPIIIKALQAGKHVISDKPICTSLAQFEQIEQLAQKNNLIVGCQLDLRSSGSLIKAQQLIADDTIGEIHTVSFSGQHPLMLNSRPQWYFQPGQQGGTINDIAIHAFDAIPWITNRQITAIHAARVWNAKAKSVPFFQDGAQVMLTLDNQGGVMGDVSYLAPDTCGYSLPHYWRFVFHGTNGILECNYKSSQLLLAKNDDAKPQILEKTSDQPGKYFQDFLFHLQDQQDQAELKMKDILTASRLALQAQQIADQDFQA